MMQKIKVIAVVFLVVLACLQLCSCQSSSEPEQKEQSIVSSSEETIPEEYIDCLEKFLDAMTTDTSQSAKYAYFPNETIRQAHKDSGITLVSYSIESAEKITDNLYAFDLILEDTYNPDPYEQWKFVGAIDGEILVIVNVNYIPEELAPNLDKGRYEYNTDETLSPDDSIIFNLGG